MNRIDSLNYDELKRSLSAFPNRTVVDIKSNLNRGNKFVVKCNQMNLGIIVDILGWSLISAFKKEKRPITAPITIVDHREDDSWEFFSNNYLTKVRIASLEEAMDNDSSVEEIRDLPLGFSAERKTINSSWIRHKTTER